MRKTSFEFDDELFDRATLVLSGTQTVSQLARLAFEEKIRRLETRDEQARKELFRRDCEIMRPIVMEILHEMQEGRVV